MINRNVVGAHYGLKDWIAQRATAVIMALYTIILTAVVLVACPRDFEAWRAIFANNLMKLATLVVFLSLFYHAWVGMRDIWMDYVKPTGLRLVLHILTVIALVGYAVWAASILLGVKA